MMPCPLGETLQLFVSAAAASETEGSIMQACLHRMPKKSFAKVASSAAMAAMSSNLKVWFALCQAF